MTSQNPQPPSLMPIIALAIINGMFSPFLAIVFGLNGLWFPFFLPPSLPLIFTLSSLLLSTLYLMVSGVPAALYERFAGGGAASLTSRLIWLGVMAAMTLPTLPNLVKALSEG